MFSCRKYRAEFNPMSKLQDALNQITDPTVADAKSQFEQLINEGKAASEAFIKSSAEQLEQWTIDVSNGKMSQDEFDNLVSSQAILAKNFVASQALAAQERAEQLTIKTSELPATKIMPLFITLSLRRRSESRAVPERESSSVPG